MRYQVLRHAQVNKHKFSIDNTNMCTRWVTWYNLHFYNIKTAMVSIQILVWDYCK